MSSSDNLNPLEAAIGQELGARAAKVAHGDCPPLMDLASYADGRLAGKRVRAMEGHLAGCDDCVQAILSAKEAAAEPVSMEIVEAARALVSGRRRPADSGEGRLLLWPAIGRWGLAAAASLAICVIGYRTGLASPSVVTEDEIVAALSFGALEAGAGGEETLAMLVGVIEEGQ